MYLVNGKTGRDVTGADDAALYAGILGSGDYVLAGSTITVQQHTTSTLTIGKADIIMQGYHGRIEGTETLTVINGEAGKYRRDLVVAEYSISGTTESMTLKMVKGTSATSEAGANKPGLTKGDLLNGATRRQMELAEVLMYENRVVSITPTTVTAPSVGDFAYIKSVESKVNENSAILASRGTNYSSGTVDAVINTNGGYEEVASVDLPEGTYEISYGIITDINESWVKMMATTSKPSNDSVFTSMQGVIDPAKDEPRINKTALSCHNSRIVGISPSSGSTQKLTLWGKVYNPFSAVHSVKGYIRAVKIGG